MLVEDLENNRYVTLLLVSLDGMSRRLSFAGAGRLPGFF
jgi:serine phosphatase RsbU (regulator of sigma subunit)